MPATQQRRNGGSRPSSARSGSTSRSKPKASSANQSSGSSRSSAAKTRSSGAKTRARASSSRSRTQSSAQRAKSDGRSSSGGGTTQSVKQTAQSAGSAVKGVVVPVATAALGAAAGVVLGRTALARRRKVLGVKVPGTGGGLDTLAKNVGEAGKQLGRFAGEVRVAREKAEEIGKALT